MISIALFILSAILLLLLIRKSSYFLKFFMFSLLVAAFLFVNVKNGHVAMAFSSLKNWIQATNLKEGDLSEAQDPFPIVKIKDRVLLNAPAVSQFPELPRGCEVTSLAMMLNQAGIQTNKMELAEKIKKDPTPLKIDNGQIFYGNPNDGFVGNMYDLNQAGFGVYHKPIAELANSFLPGKIKDLTGASFEELTTHLSDGRSVWVIINTSFKKLDDNQFQTWDTPTGKVKITYKEHSVLLTGYDKQFVYFNDPLSGEKNKKAPLKEFADAWVQMGSQAITYFR
ncbi:C39 family peptidase [Neobacillus sp. SM06]|uniref:C39 family peptidase n=1 Tax=Neobacillus sp. SM06 TaxID=3422492 RepID=UPI003D2A891C